MSTATCPTNDILSAYAFGDLPTAERNAVKEHAAECAECGALLRKMGRLSALQIEEVPTADTLPALTEFEPISGLTPVNDLPGGPTRSLTGAAATPLYKGMLLPPQQADEIGRLGPYRVLSVLGEGGMGIVFRAEDPMLKRLVALKVLQPDVAQQETSRQRFLREARATAALAHDNVVSVYQVGEDRGIPFIAMQLLEGETLEAPVKRAKGKPMPIADVLRIGKEICDGLAAAHDHGLIHRDIKPSNIWLEAGRKRVKIVDFGLARDQFADVRITQTGRVVGTPGYMSPEQVESKEVGPRSDLFSLGCLLYRMASGHDAFKGETAFDTLRSVVQDEPLPIAPSDKAPAEFIALLDQLLRKKPDERPASGAAVSKRLQAIRKALTKPEEPLEQRLVKALAKPPAPPPPSRDYGWIVVLLGMVGGLGVGAYFLSQSSNKEDEKGFENSFGPLAKPEAPAPKPSAPIDEKFIAYATKLAPLPQARAITQKLIELNPGFDGDMVRSTDPTTHATTRIVLSTDHVSVIWPLRAFPELQSLLLNGSAPGKGCITDLTALKGMKIRNLELRNNAIESFAPLKDVQNLEVLKCEVDPKRDASTLQALPLLRRLNDKPVKQFWKDAQ
jgi:serine/threonine protein kinase